jgi:hypothetical protein
MTRDSAITRIVEICERYEEMMDKLSKQSLTSDVREMIQEERRKALKEISELSKRL